MPFRIRASSQLAAAILLAAAAMGASAESHVRPSPPAHATRAPLLRFASIDHVIRYAIAHERWRPQRPPADFAITGPDDPRAFSDVARRTRIETLASARLGTFKAVYLPFPGDDTSASATIVYVLRASDKHLVRVARLPVGERCRIEDTSSLLFCDEPFSMSLRGRRWLGDRFED